MSRKERKERKEAFMSACQSGDMDVVTQLLAGGEFDDINYADWGGATFLCCASRGGHTDVVGQLLVAGAEVNPVTKSGCTPLYHSAQMGHGAVVEQLLKAGAEVNQATKGGYTPLYIAAQMGHSEVVGQLLKAGAEVNQAAKGGNRPLNIAAQQGHSEVVGQLIDAGAMVNQATKGGHTPLYIAVQKGHAAVVGQLLEAGANNINQASDFGLTLLFIAARLGHRAVVGQLLEAGADGGTTLQIAKKNAHDGAVRCLTEAIAARNKQFMGFCLDGNVDDVRQSLERGVEINCVDPLGRTPLYRAVQNKHVDVVSLLVRAGGRHDAPGSDLPVLKDLSPEVMVVLIGGDATAFRQRDQDIQVQILAVIKNLHRSKNLLAISTEERLELQKNMLYSIHSQKFHIKGGKHAPDGIKPKLFEALGSIFGGATEEPARFLSRLHAKTRSWYFEHLLSGVADVESSLAVWARDNQVMEALASCNKEGEKSLLSFIEQRASDRPAHLKAIIALYAKAFPGKALPQEKDNGPVEAEAPASEETLSNYFAAHIEKEIQLSKEWNDFYKGDGRELIAFLAQVKTEENFNQFYDHLPEVMPKEMVYLFKDELLQELEGKSPQQAKKIAYLKSSSSGVEIESSESDEAVELEQVKPTKVTSCGLVDWSLFNRGGHQAEADAKEAQGEVLAI